MPPKSNSSLFHHFSWDPSGLSSSHWWWQQSLRSSSFFHLILPPLPGLILFQKVKSDVSFTYTHGTQWAPIWTKSKNSVSCPTRSVYMELFISTHIYSHMSPPILYREPCSVISVSPYTKFVTSLHFLKVISAFAYYLQDSCCLAIIHIHVFQQDLSRIPLLPDSRVPPVRHSSAYTGLGAGVQVNNSSRYLGFLFS